MNDYLDWARGRMEKVVKKRLETLMENIKPEVIEGFGKPPEHLIGGGEAIWERCKRLDFTMDRCREAANSGQRDPLFDIECGFNVWLHKGYFYVIVIAEGYITESVRTRKPRWVEEYHYQNQADQPKEISDRDWNERRRNWEAVCAGTPSNHNNRRLYFDVISAKTEMDLFDLKWSMGTRAVHEWVDRKRK